MEAMSLKEKKTLKKEIETYLTKDQIAFQRGFLLMPDKAASKQKRLTIQAELMKLGYML